MFCTGFYKRKSSFLWYKCSEMQLLSCMIVDMHNFEAISLNIFQKYKEYYIACYSQHLEFF